MTSLFISVLALLLGQRDCCSIVKEIMFDMLMCRAYVGTTKHMLRLWETLGEVLRAELRKVCQGDLRSLVAGILG